MKSLKHLYTILLSYLICTQISCNEPKIKSIIAGGWTIDTIWYKNYEIRLCLVGNNIELNGDETAILPITRNYCSEAVITYETAGKWEINKQENELFIKFNTKNVIFNGINKVSFRKDRKQKLLFMAIDSKNLHMVCRKIMFNYDEDMDVGLNELASDFTGR